MDDDFGTPVALDHTFSLVRGANGSLDDGDLTAAGVQARTALMLFSVLGIEVGFADSVAASGPDDAEIETLIEQRREAREGKDFTTADRIRDQLAEAGVVLEDTSAGVVWHRT
jgi:cysteinyl-tRNA synthetase